MGRARWDARRRNRFHGRPTRLRIRPGSPGSPVAWRAPVAALARRVRLGTGPTPRGIRRGRRPTTPRSATRARAAVCRIARTPPTRWSASAMPPAGAPRTASFSTIPTTSSQPRRRNIGTQTPRTEGIREGRSPGDEAASPTPRARARAESAGGRGVPRMSIRKGAVDPLGGPDRGRSGVLMTHLEDGSPGSPRTTSPRRRNRSGRSGGSTPCVESNPSAAATCSPGCG